MKKIMLLAVSSLIIFQTTVFAQNISDYLITNDIGSYRKITSGGPTGSILAGTDHFYLDHSDTALGIAYVNDAQKMWVDVQVTQHTGGDSDRWLLHELDKEFRTYYGIPDDAYAMRLINGNNIITDGSGGWTYRWLSGNKVINIEYTDLQGNKSEPLEVVNAYLAKHPSTLSAMTSADLRIADNQKKWIKDEINRRLWLCDKWNAQYQAGKTNQKDLLYNLHRSMEVFLYYREKYYSVAAKAELDALFSYKRNNDLTSIQTKLTEYKTWWNANKGKSISLP